MKYLRKFADHIRTKPSLYFFVFITVFTIDRHHRLEHALGPMPPIVSDVQEYYRFLPDIFLSEDGTSENAISTNRRTLGMAVMYAPAFITGHFIAKSKGEEQNGYSESYRWALRWGSIIYVLLGLVFLRKALLFYFKEVVVLITLVCVLLGTNLFYYTYGWGEMPHSYLFCLYALFAWMTLRWIKQERKWSLIWIGLVAGFITWIRPTGIVVLLFPLLYGIGSWSDMRQRVVLMLKHKQILILSALLFLFPLIVQMMFWKMHTGKFVYYTYGDEHFYMNDPQITNFLFSFRKGWLVYTPIMMFALIGMALSFKKLKSFFVFSLLFFAINVYVLSCWWDWGFGGSFGCRALIESYAFFAFPFALTVDWIWFNRFHVIVKSALRIALIAIFYVLIRWNMWQTELYRAGALHWSGMNKTTYMYMFGKTEFTEADYQYLNEHFTPPDAEAMKRGKRDQ